MSTTMATTTLSNSARILRRRSATPVHALYVAINRWMPVECCFRQILCGVGHVFKPVLLSLSTASAFDFVRGEGIVVSICSILLSAPYSCFFSLRRLPVDYVHPLTLAHVVQIMKIQNKQ